MKYTLRIGVCGDVEIYKTSNDLRYQHYNKMWKYAPKYYNFVVTKKYTNLPSPVILKLLKNKKVRELLMKVLRGFVV